jgi:hypothetical protein
VTRFFTVWLALIGSVFVLAVLANTAGGPAWIYYVLGSLIALAVATYAMRRT